MPAKASCNMILVVVFFAIYEPFIVNSISICLLLVRVFVSLGFVVVGTVDIILFFSFVVDFILSGLLLSICLHEYD